MKTYLEIKNPCPKNWETMKIGLNSCFCENCQKNVIDFTKKDKNMILIKNILLLLLIISLSACSNSNQQDENSSIVNSPETKTLESSPKVDFKISLKDNILNYGDPILLNLSLTNNSSDVQKLLFDKPRVSTGGPWATTGKVTDINKKISVLKYENKASLSSLSYSEDQLIDYYYLEPGQSINKQFNLTDIVLFNSKTNSLPKGSYEVQLFYYLNSSNILPIEIK